MSTTILPIEGCIGFDITPAQVRAQLAGAGDVEIQVHSPGGTLYDGIALHNALVDHRRAGHRVTARIVGMACSAASYVVLAAESITAAANAMVMIHNPHMLACGDHRALAKSAQLLDTAAAMLAEGYAARLGVTVDAARRMMDDETWWHGQEIVTAGLALALESPVTDDPLLPKSQAVARGQLAVNAMLDAVKAHPEPLERLAALLPTATTATRPSAALEIASAVESERARILGILSLPEARDRPAAAAALAQTKEMTPAAAAAILATIPATTSARHGPSEFERHMASLGNPRVGLDDDGADSQAFDPRAWSVLRTTR